jgi:hypothetical protein
LLHPIFVVSPNWTNSWVPFFAYFLLCKSKKKCTFQSTSLLADDVLYWQDKIYIKLSTIKPIHASWIIPAFQQVTKETLIRGWEKTCIKECVDNCRLWLPKLSVSHLQYDFTLWRALWFYHFISTIDTQCTCNYGSIFCNIVIKFCSWNVHLCIS